MAPVLLPYLDSSSTPCCCPRATHAFPDPSFSQSQRDLFTMSPRAWYSTSLKSFIASYLTSIKISALHCCLWGLHMLSPVHLLFNLVLSHTHSYNHVFSGPAHSLYLLSLSLFPDWLLFILMILPPRGCPWPPCPKWVSFFYPLP